MPGQWAVCLSSTLVEDTSSSFAKPLKALNLGKCATEGEPAGMTLVTFAPATSNFKELAMRLGRGISVSYWLRSFPWDFAHNRWMFRENTEVGGKSQGGIFGLGITLLAVVFLGSVGLADVPPPWTPVRVDQKEDTVWAEVWGRRIEFTRHALPTQVITAGEPLLVGPIRLMAQTEGGPLEWAPGKVIVWEKTPEKISFLGWQESESLVLNVYAELEYDGLLSLDLKLVPPRQPKGKIVHLWLEVPLRSELIRLFHFWPGRWGSAFNSGAVPAEGLRLPFKPVVWLGWEEGGLAVMAEEDRTWQPAEPERAIEVIPNGESTLLRLHLLDSPPNSLPVVFRLMFQATPVKPWASDFHWWHICHGANYGIELPARPGEESLLEKASRLGVRTLVFHEHWTPVQNYWKTDDPAKLQKLIKACHEKGIALWLYFGYELSTLAPEYAEWADRVLVRTSHGSLFGGYWRHPPQRDYVVCLKSPWGERLVEGIVKAIDLYGFDGVYLDGTIEPWGCANLLHGCGYQAKDGSLRETYPIRAVRRVMERMYRELVARGKRINAHQSTYCGPATLAFVHSYWDGEQLQGTFAKASTLETLPLDSFRAEFMGRNFGVPCEFLVYEKPPEWTMEKALAITMLHDVRVRPGWIGPMLERISPLWRAMEEFGVAQSEWHPYWRNDRYFAIEPASAKVSGYRRQVGGKVRWLLVVSNLSETEGAEITLEVKDPELPRISTATDRLTGEPIDVKGGTLRLQVPAMRMRLVEVE